MACVVDIVVCICLPGRELDALLNRKWNWICVFVCILMSEQGNKIFPFRYLYMIRVDVMVICICLPGRELNALLNHKLKWRYMFVRKSLFEPGKVWRDAVFRPRSNLFAITCNQLVEYVREISQFLRLTNLEMISIPDIHIVNNLPCLLRLKLLKPRSDRYYRV